MKKLNVSKKLSLNKETLASLSKEQMMGVKGGFLSLFSCKSKNISCCPKTDQTYK